MKKYTETYEENGWHYARTEVQDETGKSLFSVAMETDAPEDMTFFRNLSDCRNVADLLNEAYAKGVEDGRKGTA